MHAGEALWQMYAMLELIERRAGTAKDVKTALPKARECCDIIARHMQVPPPVEGQVEYRIDALSSELFEEEDGSVVTDGEAREAVDIANSILADLEELPESADDFGESVGEKVRSMREWIERNNHVTSRQRSALENMRAGTDRWMDGGRDE